MWYYSLLIWVTHDFYSHTKPNSVEYEGVYWKIQVPLSVKMVHFHGELKVQVMLGDVYVFSVRHCLKYHDLCGRELGCVWIEGLEGEGRGGLTFIF